MEMKKGDSGLGFYGGRAAEGATSDNQNIATLGSNGVQHKDVSLGPDTKVSARLYLPESQPAEKLPILLYFHGGGFYEGSPFDEAVHTFVEALSHQSRLLAVSVSYRLAPEHKLPAAYDDALLALKWVFSGADEWVAEHGDLDRVFAAGDSAGANITHTLAMEYTGAGATAGEMKIEGIALLCPYFWGVDPLPGEPTSELVRLVFSLAWIYVGLRPTDHRVNPLAPHAPNLAELGCDKVFVCLADKDFWYPRGNAYVEGLKESGWKGELEPQVYEGVDHVFWYSNLEADMAKKLMADLRAFFGTN